MLIIAVAGFCAHEFGGMCVHVAQRVLKIFVMPCCYREHSSLFLLL